MTAEPGLVPASLGPIRPAVPAHGRDPRAGALRDWLVEHGTWFLYVAFLLSNRLRRRTVLGCGEVVVSLATHGSRVATCFQAIETIARGRIRPHRLILWIGDYPDDEPLPSSLRRLERRGLEVHRTTNRVSHTKWFPYVSGIDRHLVPLVTADDDCYYDRGWLAELLEAHRRHPDDICAHRCRSIAFDGDRFAPYLSWPLAVDVGPSPRHFLTGVSGVLYPAAFLDELRARGEEYRDHSPRSDDVWLNYVATITSTPIRQLRPTAHSHLGTWGSGPGLFVTEHAMTKDQILIDAYGDELIGRLAADGR